MASDGSNSSTVAHGEWSVVTKSEDVGEIDVAVWLSLLYSTVLY